MRLSLVAFDRRAVPTKLTINGVVNRPAIP